MALALSPPAGLPAIQELDNELSVASIASVASPGAVAAQSLINLGPESPQAAWSVPNSPGPLFGKLQADGPDGQVKLSLHPKPDLAGQLAQDTAQRLLQLQEQQAGPQAHGLSPRSPSGVTRNRSLSPGRANAEHSTHSVGVGIGAMAVAVPSMEHLPSVSGRPLSPPKLVSGQSMLPGLASQAQAQYQQYQQYVSYLDAMQPPQQARGQDAVESLLGRYQVHQRVMEGLGRKAAEHALRTQRLTQHLEVRTAPRRAAPRVVAVAA